MPIGIRSLSAIKMSLLKVENIPMNSGTHIQSVGIGCWMGSASEENRVEAHRTVTLALKTGYRYIDTAAGYNNEEHVAQAIKESGVPRSEIIIQTKLPGTSHHRVREAFEESLKKLDCGYIDVYLMHWPMAKDSNGKPTDLRFTEVYKEMEKLLEDGRCKAIGISNFSIKTCTELLESGIKVMPCLNQVEAHPYYPNNDLLEYSKEKGIHLQAYSPLGQYNSPILKDEVIVDIAKSRDVTPGQVVLAWNVQRGVSVLPKSSNEKRLEQNFNLPKLDEASMKKISELYKQPGKFTRLCGNSIGGKVVMGWKLEELGWEV